MAAASPLPVAQSHRASVLLLEWFYRRPMFWLGLAAGIAILLAEEREPALWFWAVLLVVGMALALFRLPVVGAMIAVAALFGLRAGKDLHPTCVPPLPADARVTLRGVVVGTPGHVAEKRALLATTGLYVQGIWMPQSGPVGFVAPPGVDAGDELMVTGRLLTPPPTTGPGAVSERLGWLRLGARQVLRYRPEAVQRLGRRPLPSWRRIALQVRAQILAANRRTLSPTAAALVNNFLIGDSSPPDPQLSEQVAEVFRSSGLVHLLVVSGSQVTVALSLFLWLGARFRPARFVLWTLGALAVGAYYLLTDGAAPVARAVVMGLAYLVAQVLDREPDGENTLGLAALVLLGITPLALLDLGFQLSFAALWGLIRLTPPLQSALMLSPTLAKRMPPRVLGAWKALVMAVAGSVAAHLAVAPLLAWHFQTSTWSGILANLPMLALAAPFLFLGIAHTALATFAQGGLAWVAEWAARGMLAGAEFFAHPPFGTVGVFPPPVWLLPLTLVALAVPSWVIRSRSGVLLATAVLAVTLVLSERLPARPPALPTLWALDVGQGDALLLQSPGGGTMLVDGGPARLDGATPAVLRALRALRVPALDVVVASHPHADHVGGLAQVLNEFPVGLLLHNGDPAAESDVWRAVLVTAAHRQIPMLAPQSGYRLQVGGAALIVLGPPPTPSNLRPLALEDNERSLVLRWDCAGTRVLLPGDAEAGEETQLLPFAADLRAEVLKVGHHGSDSSSTAAWLAAVQPHLALISCGRGNRFGHPDPNTLDRLQVAGAVVARTDLSGTLKIEARGRRLTITPWLEARPE